MAAAEHNQRLLEALPERNIDVDEDPEEKEGELLEGGTTLDGAIQDFQQRGRAYSDINEFNLKAKTLQDALKRLFGCLAGLPNHCLGPCLGASFCLGLLAAIVYLVGMCWACKYHIYDLSYDDASAKHHHSTVTMSKSCGNPEIALYEHEHACKYYNLVDDNQCENYESSLFDDDHRMLSALGWNDNVSIITTAAPAFDLSELIIWEQIFIKAQWFLSWLIWGFLRISMQEINLFSMKYAGYFIAANVVSWNFRKMGFLTMNPCYILFSPFYPKAFIWSILTVFVCFSAWALSVIVCLKRKPDPDPNRKKTHLVLREIKGIYKGGVKAPPPNKPGKATVDSVSCAANIASIGFFVYAAATPAIWLGVVNLKEILRHSGTSAFPGHKMELVNYFITTVGNYYLPISHWYYPFCLAAYLQNLMTIVDICIFVLDGLKEINDWIVSRQDRKQRHAGGGEVSLHSA